MKSFIITGLGFGDESKGCITDLLCRAYGSDLVVRHNGGPQAAHTVYTDDGRHHVFAQFGAGTFNPGCRTLLSRYMLVNPISMLIENEHLFSQGVSDALERVYVDSRALVVTPFHRALNRLREMARGTEKHGSCGKGIGETVFHAMRYPKEAFYVDDFHSDAWVIKLAAIMTRLGHEAARLNLPDTSAASREMSTFRVDLVTLGRNYEKWLEKVKIVNPYESVSLLSNSRVAISKARKVSCWTKLTVLIRLPPGPLLRRSMPGFCYRRRK